jgi:uncharacterized protein YodC (DUF2158 family)
MLTLPSRKDDKKDDKISPLTVGDTVRFRSGSLRMTVSWVSPDSNVISLLWMTYHDNRGQVLDGVPAACVVRA